MAARSSRTHEQKVAQLLRDMEGQLPPEVIANIMSHLEAMDVKSLRRVEKMSPAGSKVKAQSARTLARSIHGRLINASPQELWDMAHDRAFDAYHREIEAHVDDLLGRPIDGINTLDKKIRSWCLFTKIREYLTDVSDNGLTPPWQFGSPQYAPVYVLSVEMPNGARHEIVAGGYVNGEFLHRVIFNGEASPRGTVRDDDDTLTEIFYKFCIPATYTSISVEIFTPPAQTEVVSRIDFR